MKPQISFSYAKSCAIMLLATPKVVVEELIHGRVGSTYKITSGSGEYILQFFSKENESQADKKEYVYNHTSFLIKNLVPRVLLSGIYKEHRYLLMEYLAGMPMFALVQKPDTITPHIKYEIAKTLELIHSWGNSTTFGWIDGTHVRQPYKSIYDYFCSELRRIDSMLSENNDEPAKELLLKLSTHPHLDSLVAQQSCLCWYDIQPGNVLVKKTGDHYSLSGLLDPGAARFGVPEWDIAHTELHLLKTNIRDNSLRKFYTSQPLNPDTIEIFKLLIILDDLSIGIERGWDDVVIEARRRVAKQIQIYKY